MAGDLVASGSQDTTAIIWDTRKQSKLFTLNAHQASVCSVEFAGGNLITASHDGTVLYPFSLLFYFLFYSFLPVDIKCTSISSEYSLHKLQNLNSSGNSVQRLLYKQKNPLLSAKLCSETEFL